MGGGGEEEEKWRARTPRSSRDRLAASGPQLTSSDREKRLHMKRGGGRQRVGSDPRAGRTGPGCSPPPSSPSLKSSSHPHHGSFFSTAAPPPAPGPLHSGAPLPQSTAGTRGTGEAWPHGCPARLPAASQAAPRPQQSATGARDRENGGDAIGAPEGTPTLTSCSARGSSTPGEKRK